ncbi:MAG: aminotransferase class I/II-fold pyridoxal phosphate-dependent enzyme [Proteobacteria bacterium]|nr:aminotransferase class I/II-fold pyridoxal phosphate-dependent enzyme [Pseudomonadota bacterium]
MSIARTYAPPRHAAPVDLDLSGGERSEDAAPLSVLLSGLTPEALRCYPRTAELAALFAQQVGVDSDQVFVTAGADEAIDRICRAELEPGANAVCTRPCFEMIPRYVAFAHAELRQVEWHEGPLPASQLLASVDQATRLLIVVSPNNPTGGTVTRPDLQTLAGARPELPVLLDLAYGEFADEDLTGLALSFPNVTVTRTLSKAWGLAGLRVGFALGSPERIDSLRAAGSPYSVAGPSVAIAKRALERGERSKEAYVGQVRKERARLRKLAVSLAWSCEPSQGNFVLWRGTRALWLRDCLAGLGIAVRVFPDEPSLANAVRITCPGEAAAFRRLEDALLCALRPDALLLELEAVCRDGQDDRELLERLRARMRLGLVTTGSSEEALGMLRARGIQDCFDALACCRDGKLQDGSAALRAALHDLSEPSGRCARAWYVGQTLEGLAAARKAALVPLALADSEARVETSLGFLEHGAARVMTQLETLQEWLP